MTKKEFIKRFDNMNWFCINWDFNNKRPYYVNIMNCFNAENVYEKLQDMKSYEELYRYLHSELFAMYSSRAEYEMTITGLWNTDPEFGIDVYDQIAINFDKFVRYFNDELELGFDKQPVDNVRICRFL